jgi:GntR family transcriptional regulator
MPAELDYASGIPLYRQIMDILRSEILGGQVDEETPMTEAKLMERFNVSLAPIRQALKDLTGEGLVYRKQGKGTFPITGRRVDRPADLKTGDLYKFLESRGLHPTSEVSGIERTSAPSQAAASLGTTDRNLLHFLRVIKVDGKPFAENDVFIKAPDDFAPTATELNDGGSALQMLEAKYGIALEHSEHEAWATSASKSQAKLLGVKEGSPVLVIDTTFYARGGVAIGWRRAVHKPNEFKFHFLTGA